MTLLDPILPIRLIRRIVGVFHVGTLVVRRILLGRAHENVLSFDSHQHGAMVQLRLQLVPLLPVSRSENVTKIFISYWFYEGTA